jgi:DNA-damage-inducible protein D
MPCNWVEQLSTKCGKLAALPKKEKILMKYDKEEQEQQEQHALLPLAGVERIRRVIHEGQEYWSVIDVIAFLTDAATPSKYWNTMRSRMRTEGARETLSQIIQLPMRSADGRLRKTDAMTRPTLLRLLQSIPSPKAEPFKLFLAEAGEEILTEVEQQSNTLEGLRDHYRRLHRDEEWITARILYIATRNAWTSEIQLRGVGDSPSIARLTSLLNLRTFGVTTAQHKAIKHLPTRENLADHKTRMELILSSLGEETATGLHQKHDSQGYDEIEQDVKVAGDVAAAARRDVEEQLGEPVVSSQNFLELPKEKRKKRALPAPAAGQETLYDATDQRKD